ncbi:hypothetical protein BCR44DRAFT_1511603 [Catenaria anguillulae PL171]|uniref:Transcription factor CBF/NF-Y/archaeal histone domain-containing protein n=1 Tax=Catenaria anguillulae PL171 TaxID=765915 RepID=A0A1Y2HS42_9FUNG|nr:hypothetical protein BCR44DRAFT_1511603 [Catenaria anguillulae PL171]
MDPQESTSAAGTDADAPADLTSTIFPVSRIRKIVKEDPDVHNVSQEGIFLMTKAAEMFLEKLVWAASESADADKRKLYSTRIWFGHRIPWTSFSSLKTFSRGSKVYSAVQLE